MADILEGLNGRIATIGAIITGIVGFNSALTSCSADTVNRYAGFRGAVQTEEGFWKDRYTEYVEIVGEENPKVRKDKLFALAALAQHDVPKFEEFRLGLFDSGDARKVAIERLNGMRDTLNAALTSATTGDPDVAAAVQQSVAFDDVQQAEVPARSGGETSVEVQAATVATVAAVSVGTPDFTNQVLSAGTPSGWDIDVFWCAGGGNENETTNYSSAVDVAKQLAAQASTGRPLSVGVKLGRVRLRPLPDLRQGGSYPARGSGNTLRAESSTGEQLAASALLTALNGSNHKFSITGSRMVTPFYMSAFVCGAANAINTTMSISARNEKP